MQVSLRFEADYGGLLKLERVEAVVEYEVMEEKIIELPANETAGGAEGAAAGGASAHRSGRVRCTGYDSQVVGCGVFLIPVEGCNLTPCRRSAGERLASQSLRTAGANALMPCPEFTCYAGNSTANADAAADDAAAKSGSSASSNSDTDTEDNDDEEKGSKEGAEGQQEEGGEKQNGEGGEGEGKEEEEGKEEGEEKAEGEGEGEEEGKEQDAEDKAEKKEGGDKEEKKEVGLGEVVAAKRGRAIPRGGAVAGREACCGEPAGGGLVLSV